MLLLFLYQDYRMFDPARAANWPLMSYQDHRMFDPARAADWPLMSYQDHHTLFCSLSQASAFVKATVPALAEDGKLFQLDGGIHR